MKYFYSEFTGLVKVEGKKAQTSTVEYFETEDLAYINFYKNKLSSHLNAINHHKEQIEKITKDKNKLIESFGHLENLYPEEFI